MEEIKTEETKDNPIVEEPIVEEKPQAETETPIKETDSPKKEYTESEKRLYARMKKAEEEAKNLKEELVKSKVPISDIDAILEVQSSTQGLDPQEIAELKLRATAGNISLTEARKDQNFLIWQEGMRDKVAKENAAKPSTLQPEVERKKTFIEKLRDTETKPTITVDGKKYVSGRAHLDSINKQAEILEKKGRWNNPRRRDASKKIQLSQNQ